MCLFGLNIREMLEEEAANRRRGSFTSARLRRQQSARITQLEDELARVSLLTFALADLCLDTGLVTLDDLKERLRKIDLSDGVEDGKLAAGRPLPGSPPAPAQPPTAAVPPVRRRRFRARD
jgi:predicted Zn-dependent peptidase